MFCLCLLGVTESERQGTGPIGFGAREFCHQGLLSCCGRGRVPDRAKLSVVMKGSARVCGLTRSPEPTGCLDGLPEDGPLRRASWIAMQKLDAENQVALQIA
jgi:hypothetical protein